MDREQRQEPREGRKGKRERSSAQETSAIGRKSEHWPALSRRTGGTGTSGLVNSARETNKARAVVGIYRIPLKRGGCPSRTPSIPLRRKLNIEIGYLLAARRLAGGAWACGCRRHRDASGDASWGCVKVLLWGRSCCSWSGGGGRTMRCD